MLHFQQEEEIAAADLQVGEEVMRYETTNL